MEGNGEHRFSDLNAGDPAFQTDLEGASDWSVPPSDPRDRNSQPCMRTCSVTQPCRTLCDPMDCSPAGSSVHGDPPGKNTGGGCHALLQGIFPIQGLKPSLLHCRSILYCLSHKGSQEGHKETVNKNIIMTDKCYGEN